MDALKAEIAAKRKILEAENGSRPTKYMRRGDIEKMKQEQEQEAKQQRAQIVHEEAGNNTKVIEQAKSDANVSHSLVLYRYVVNTSMESGSHLGRLPLRLLLNRGIQAHQFPNHPLTSQTRRPYADFAPRDNLSGCLPNQIETGGCVYAHWN